MNLQKYSIHDGPGIRTTVFMKGCPLKCWWCHNPESWAFKQQIMYFEEKCTKCGQCVEKCPNEAIYFFDKKIVTDLSKCNLCGKCVNRCINDALEIVGQKFSVKELIKEILKDQVFYEQSGGGVTFSGGEALHQIDFLSEALKACKMRGIHTTLDTSGYAPRESFERIIDDVDLFLYDLKMIDDDAHKKYTGVSNKIILENIEYLSDNNKKIFVRIPLIAGVNDSDKSIEKFVNYITKININQVNLLPYHKMGMEKYKRIGLENNMAGNEVPSEEVINKFKTALSEKNIQVKVGG